MMKKMAYASLFVLAVVSCKKNGTTNGPETSFIVPSTPGSHWVYSCSKIDSSGVETSLGITDTVTLLGVEWFGGYPWLKFGGTEFGIQLEPWYQRDSSGYIVDVDGNIMYSYVHTETLLSTTADNGAGYSFQRLMSGSVAVTVPAGSFEALDAELVVGMTDQSPVNVCGDQTASFHSYYASGVGLVERTVAYVSEMQAQCAYRRRVLTSYHIAP